MPVTITGPRQLPTGQNVNTQPGSPPQAIQPAPLPWYAEVVASPRMSPEFGAHRGLPVTGQPNGSPQTIRAPSMQDKRGGSADYSGYPYKDTTPSTLAKQNNPQHRNDGPQGFDFGLIDYGSNPDRIPRFWRDGIREWDGLDQHGMDQQNFRLHLFHLIPLSTVRGSRSISGVLSQAGGASASRVRIPAIFVPGSVS